MPQSTICLSDTWSIHAYAARAKAEPEPEPTAVLERSLDARGACGRRARIWVTEAGAGAPHPGRARAAGAQDEHAGCLALAAQLQQWVADPRIEAILQYSFREDPAFPVGLMNAALSHVYPAYRAVAALHARERRGAPLPAQPALCA